MTRPRLLDLFCGAGGAAMGYHRAGFDVVGVDIKPQPHYPFEFHQADALTFPLDGFDAIHASPPCQAWTAYRRTGLVGESPELIEPVRDKLNATGLPHVIENVEGAPLVGAVRYCGTSFGRPIRRHRLFESSVFLMTRPCEHASFGPRFPASTNRKKNSRRTLAIGQWNVSWADQCQAMDIAWMTLDELSEAIPPAYTEHIGRQLLAAIAAERVA